MKLEDLHKGMVVRIIEWESEMDSGEDIYDYRPEHWAEDGDMDEYQGAVVTILEVDEERRKVFIEDDNNDWEWEPWDFEYYESLSHDNPNIRYRMHKHKMRMDKRKKISKKMKTIT